jgi:hypothetical protein
MDNEALTVALSALILCAIGIGLFVAMVVSAIKYPVYWIFGLVVLMLAVSCSKADERTFEVSVIIEQESDRAAADEAVKAAAYIWRTQVGVDISAVSVTVARVAEHTKAEALLEAVSMYRLDNEAMLKTDATVLFTTRTLTRGYEGIATIGPACSILSTAVVRLRSDGIDGEVLAHELLHTVGVPHDAGPGWLMSESRARTSAPSMSPDSVLTFKAAPLDCTAKIEPRAVNQSGGAVPPASAGGGGGSFDTVWLAVLGVFAVFVLLHRAMQADKRFAQWQTEEINRLTHELVNRLPTDFVLKDISQVTTQEFTNGERSVVVRFHTLTGMSDFAVWIQDQANAARMGRP